MKRLLLAALIAAGLFAMPAQAGDPVETVSDFRAVTIGETTVSLSWTAAETHAHSYRPLQHPLVSYQVQINGCNPAIARREGIHCTNHARKFPSSSPKDLPATATQTSFTGLAPGADYQAAIIPIYRTPEYRRPSEGPTYRGRAGWFFFRTKGTFVPPLERPAPPPKVACQYADGLLTMTWRPVARVSRYWVVIQPWPRQGRVFTSDMYYSFPDIDAGATSFRFNVAQSRLPPGGTIAHVHAHNSSGGAGDAGSQCSFEIPSPPEPPPPPPPTTPPAAPAPVCRVADDTLTVTWPPVTGATRYTRRLGTASGKMARATTSSTTTWRITGADLRKQPDYRRVYVNAENDAGTSAYRSCAFETPTEPPPPTTPPAAPSPVCRVADDTLTVTWPSVTGATRYTRRLGTTSGTMASATTSSTTTWRITGADLRRQPTYRRAYVNAGNDAGASAYRSCAFETPTETESDADACRWEHRFNTFPATDSPGRGVLRVSARKKGARVRIEAFDRADGTGLTVLDLAPDRDRLESGSSVTLGAANTVERFAVEGDSGQHVLIVSHAEHVAGMRAVTASMVRQSGGMSQVIHPDVVEHCAPAQSETTP